MKNATIAFVLFVLTAPALLFSCKKDGDSAENKTPVLSISDTARAVSENVSTLTLTLTLNEAAKQEIPISYALSGTAIFNGDYEVDSTASKLTIAAGSNTATLKLNIHDDVLVEGTKTIVVNFTSAAAVTFAASKSTITITDNDASRSATGLQADLAWNAGTRVDMDLYLVNNVVITNNAITDFDVVSASDNDRGFESLLLNNTAPDGQYYFVVHYASGARDVTFSLTFNGPGLTEQKSDDMFLTSEAGLAAFYGPIKKVGSTYSRLAGGNFSLPKGKPIIYRGSIK